jgi:beta-glucosidase
MPNLQLPDGFLIGAATAAYQIEGAVDEDGRAPSIWDTFSHTPGKVAGGHTGDVACDHYHRMDEDVALMAELGLDAYRFSIAWPRILPDGRGPVNPAGLGFYDRLVDRLLEHGITPFPTLYHWDLPQALEDEGGWRNRATAEAFATYAETVASHLGDRVAHWTTLNEPWVSAHLGQVMGIHAPGRTDLGEGLATGHHLLLAHGMAVPRIRRSAPGAKVGIVLILVDVTAMSAHPADVAAATIADGTANRWFLDPIAGRGYPGDAVAAFGWDGAPVFDGDLAIIAEPIDFLGVNYYTRMIEGSPGLADRPEPVVRSSGELTDMGWEVYPEGLENVLRRVDREYGFPRLYVTENGVACPEPDHVEASIEDTGRIAYLERHLEAAARAAAAGVPLGGYFVWSLLDNFEWSFGYTKRFGLVHVDYDTLTRTPKRSYHWLRELQAARRRT